jgi:hypothetical protein
VKASLFSCEQIVSGGLRGKLPKEPAPPGKGSFANRHSDGECCPRDEVARVEDEVAEGFEEEAGDEVETAVEIEDVEIELVECVAFEASSDSLYFGALT